MVSGARLRPARSQKSAGARGRMAAPAVLRSGSASHLASAVGESWGVGLKVLQSDEAIRLGLLANCRVSREV